MKFIALAIDNHMKSDSYKIAEDAELYDRQLNSTINSVVRTIYTKAGIPIEDPVSSNTKIASNFFHRLNTDLVSYLLGNGVMFQDHITKEENPDGSVTVHDETKEAFADDFDRVVYDAVYSGEIEGSSYTYVTQGKDGKYDLTLYKLTEFVPLLDEYDSSLRAGIRFWSLEWGKRPVVAILYEEDGITEYRTKPGTKGLFLEEYKKKRPYSRIIQKTEVRGVEVIGGANPFTRLPIIPYYAKYKQSTLVGMKASIDAHDLIMSGFANDLRDCSQIFWLIGGALGTSDKQAAEFRERLLFQHIGVIDNENSEVKPYVQEVPFESRKVFLESIRESLYEGIGGFNIKQLINGDRTATEIQANYNAMDQEADALKTRVSEYLKNLLSLVGRKDRPQYKRNRIANLLEQTQMVVMAAEYLSTRAILEKLPWITADEVDTILAEKSGEADERRDSEDNNDEINGGETL